MRQQKRRIGTVLLCAVLILSNILSVGMPVYAKTPDPDMDTASTVYANETVSPTVTEQPDEPSNASKDNDKNTGTDIGHTTNGEASDSSGSKDNSDAGDANGSGASDTGNPDSDGPTTDNETPDSGDNSGKESDSDTETGNSTDDSDHNNSTGSDSNEGSSDTDSSDSSDSADDNASNDTGTGNSTDNTNDSDESTDADNDLSESEPVSDENRVLADEQQDTDSEYPIQYPTGIVSMSDITLTPRSYSVGLSVDIVVSSRTSGSISAYTSTEEILAINFEQGLRLLTTVGDASTIDFFRGKAQITTDELNSSTTKWQIAEYTSTGMDYSQEPKFSLTGTFGGSGDKALAPSTAYQYRLAFYDQSTDTYSFLTAPGQFTTTEALTESSVSVRDFLVEDIGYTTARIAWTIDNPNNEDISDIKLVLTDGTESGESWTIDANPYLDANWKEIPGKYYSHMTLPEWVKDAKVSYSSLIGGEKKTYLSKETIPVEAKDIKEAEIALETQKGSSSFQTLLTLTPAYDIDASIGFNLFFWPKTAGIDAKNSKYGSASYDKAQNAASCVISLASLQADTEYEYYIQPSGILGSRAFESLGSEEKPLTFTTKTVVTYEDTDFPDDVFRSYLKNKIRISEEDKITSDRLEAITGINDFERYQATGEIKSLEGIRYLTCLTYFNLDGHAISEGAEELGQLTNLTSVFMSNNDLTQLPDLSGLKLLRSASFNYNKISEGSITADKLPASLLANDPDWISRTRSNQRGEVTLTTAPQYYKSGEAQPFLVQVTGLKNDSNRKYTLSVTIDGKTITSQGVSCNYYNMYYIPDLLTDASGAGTGLTIEDGRSYTAAVTLTDSYGQEWLANAATNEFTFSSSSGPQAKTKYIKANAQSAQIQIENLPDSLNQGAIENVTLIAGTNGDIIGSADPSSIYFNSDYYNPYEDVFGSFYIEDLQTEFRKILYADVYFARYPAAGDYSAVITLTDGTNYIAGRAVHVADTAIYESLSVANSYNGSYDNYGDHLYVTLYGANIDPSKVTPVFYEDDTDITECVSYVSTSDKESATYKLKKRNPDTYWNGSGSRSYTYRLVYADGYTEYVDAIRNKKLTVSLSSGVHDFVLFEHYNYKKKFYEVKTDSSIAEGTEITVAVYDRNSQDSSRSKLGEATVRIADSFLSLKFIDDKGVEYAPPRYNTAYFTYSYRDADGQTRTFEHSTYVQWYNYYSGSTSGGKRAYSDTVLYQQASLKELAVSVYIPTERIANGQNVTANVNNDSVKMTKGSTANGYVKYTGNWKSSTGLGEGIYRIQYLLDEQSLLTQSLYVYDNSKFYMSDQWLGTWTDRNGEDGIYVEFASEQMAGNYIHQYNGKVSNADALKYWKDTNNGYKLELFDRFGNPVTDNWNVVDASWGDSYFNLYIKGTSKEYTGFYAKITKSGQLGTRLDSGSLYYETAYNANTEYGQWETIFSRSVWFSDVSGNNAYSAVGTQAYPVTLTITKPYDTDVIRTFTARQPTNKNTDLYYFTETDLTGIRSDEAYRITASDADGNVRSEICYLAVYTQSGDVYDYKFVDQQSNTVTSLTFDILTDTAKKIRVSDGTNDISGSVTWSSTDESIVTVAQGIVTPISSGSAKILAAVRNGPTLECPVTVTRKSLTSVKLDTTAFTLQLNGSVSGTDTEPGMDSDPETDNSTKQVRLYLTPNDPSAIQEITWSSDNPAIASVTPDTQNAEESVSLTATITAVSKGEARISASVITKDGKALKTADGSDPSCTVTVQTVTTAEDAETTRPVGLTALTNELLTLEDVKLPENSGWSWQYPDVSLKQFAGMQEKAFAAQYVKEDGAAPYETDLSVALGTVTGIAILADSSTFHKDSSDTAPALSILWKISGNLAVFNDDYMDIYAEKVTWSIDKQNVATLSSETGTTVYLTGLNAGKATIKAQVTFKDGKTYKTQYKITVTEGALADIQVTGIDNFTKETADSDHASLYRINVSDPDLNNAKASAIHVTTTNSTKLTVKSSNPKVIATGKVTAAKSADSTVSAYTIPLTIKAAGRTRITLTANDTSKTRKEIWLDVTDARPSISEDTITVNLMQTTGTTFFLYPNTGYTTELPKLADADGNSSTNASRFEVKALTAKDESGNDTIVPNGYVLTAKEGTEAPAAGNYQLTLQGQTILDGKAYPYDSIPFTVKVVNQAPKYKLRQSNKVNLFFSDWESPLEVTTDETLTNIQTLDSDSDFAITRDEASGTYFLKAREAGLSTNCNKKLRLTLQFEGYKDITTDYTVSVEKKTPKTTINSKSVTLYPAYGLESAQLTPTVIMPDGYTFKGLTANIDDAAKEKGLSLITENGKLYLRSIGITGNTTIRTKLTLSNSLWASSITIPLTVKVNMGKPSVKLQKSSLQLNANEAFLTYEMSSTEVMWKDGAIFNPIGVSVSAIDAKAQNIINTGIVFSFNKDENKLIAKLNNVEVAKGNYKFKVNVRLTDTITLSTPLTVKVVNTAMDKSVKVSAKGSIDVLNRENTFVTVTPALKAMNGTVTAIRLSGRAAHLFDAVCDDGKVIIHAKPDAKLITKYNYKVNLNLTIENAEGGTFRYITPEISLKLKQGKPKVTIAPKSGTFFSGSYNNHITRKVSAALKGAPNPVIERIELINNTDAFTCDHTEADNSFTLSSTAEAVKGKTYSLQLKVTFKDQADNEKATVIKYSVKVK